MSAQTETHPLQSLPLSLSVAQGRLLMGALAELPFKRVFELIGKLNAGAQAPAAASASLRIRLSAAELALVLEALGQLPYVQVHALIDELHAQVRQASSQPLAGKKRRGRSAP